MRNAPLGTCIFPPTFYIALDRGLTLEDVTRRASNRMGAEMSSGSGSSAGLAGARRGFAAAWMRDRLRHALPPDT
jgi:hypothetical protein